jgi:ATP-dependent helicase IRC3
MGGDVSQARQVWQQLLLDHPGFELEAGALTLPEIQDRAAAFNPLTLEVHEDVRAISSNDWFSLGRRGLGLHFEKFPGRASEVVVLKRPGRGKIWEVLIDETSMARFSNLEDAVAAVDYELERRGRLTALSALPTAPWRRGESGSMRAKALQQALWDRIVGRADTRAIRAQ